MQQNDPPVQEKRTRPAALGEVAREICRARGMRLTDLRLATLEEVADNGPISAYRLMPLLGRRLDRRIDPPTVYRALEFLIDAGLVARLGSRAVYVLRERPGQSEPSVVLLCNHCESTVQVEDPELMRLIAGDAAALGFRLGSPVIECSGTCGRCAESGEAAR
ncbi:Fur family transcriptional regulator [Reyranella sp.]|uniref:Fur family transcriptional regulator n=1 Tax=Reyranella sp. TaxID=1929291 RepID=UPI003BAA0DF2